jgi:hypothetical protein
MVKHYNFCSVNIITATIYKKLATIATDAQVILFTANKKSRS